MPLGTRAPSRSKRFGCRRKSTTSISSARTSSTPATSPHVTAERELGDTCVGLTRGITLSVRQSRKTIKPVRTKKPSGSQFMAHWPNSCNNLPTSGMTPLSARRRYPLNEGRDRPSASRQTRSGFVRLGGTAESAPRRGTEPRDDLVRRRELDPALAPRGRAGGDTRFVQAPRGILDESHSPPAFEQAANRGGVADVRCHAEEDHLVRIERLEQPLGIRIREHVEVLLEEYELAALEVALREWLEPDRHGIPLVGLGHLPRATRTTQAMRRIRRREVGPVGDLRIG